MRRIKTYVLMVGVALSVTPIFHYSHAQQSNSNTQILLDVQALKQEIAELRDMVERQNYQMKRLQRQLDQAAQPNAASAYQSNGAYAANNQSYSQPENAQRANAGDLGQPPVDQAIRDQAAGALPEPISSGASVQTKDLNAPNTIIQGANQEQAATSGAGNFYRPYPNAQDAQVNAADVTGAVASAAEQADTYPPVVDRSFNTTKPAVPVTGAGAQSTAAGVQSTVAEAQSTIDSQRQTSQQWSVASSAVKVSDAVQQTQVGEVLSDNAQQQSRQAQAQSSGGVVSIPSSSSIEATNQAINAAQVPAQVGTPAASNSEQVLASNSTKAADALDQVPSSVKPENEFYSEGIELLKQSQYEQAAVIFEQQLQAHPRGSLADGAHYWIAEAMFLNRKLDVAKSHLKTIITDYPQSSRIPNAMLKTAYIEQSQGNKIEARVLFQEIVTLYPQSDAAIAAKNQLASDS